MTEYRIGNLIAFQDEDGHVYTGIVKSVSDNGYAVDILSDGTYREPIKQ